LPTAPIAEFFTVTAPSETHYVGAPFTVTVASTPAGGDAGQVVNVSLGSALSGPSSVQLDDNGTATFTVIPTSQGSGANGGITVSDSQPRPALGETYVNVYEPVPAQLFTVTMPIASYVRTPFTATIVSFPAGADADQIVTLHLSPALSTAANSIQLDGNGTATFTVTPTSIGDGTVFAEDSQSTPSGGHGVTVVREPVRAVSFTVTVPSVSYVGVPFTATIASRPAGADADQVVTLLVGSALRTASTSIQLDGNGTATFTVTPTTVTPTSLGLGDQSTTIIATDSDPLLAIGEGENEVREPESPTVTNQPHDQTAVLGSDVSFWVSASGTPPLAYQWSFNGKPITGATSSILTISPTVLNSVGTYAVTVSNAQGSAASSPAGFEPNPLGEPPGILLQPVSYSMNLGSTFVLSTIVVGDANSALVPSISGSSLSASASGALASRVATQGDQYQWFFNGAAILGATDPMYVLSNATTDNVGSYSCLVTNSAGSTITSAAQISIVSAASPGHLVNISSRAAVGTGPNQMIMGFVVGGPDPAGTDEMLIRVSGPALSQFGVSGTLPDPLLQLNNGSGIIAANQGWGGAPLIAGTATSAGAFAWTDASSLDSALVNPLQVGNYTAVIGGASGDSGVVLAEVYDATPTGDYGLTSAHLTNISTRAQVGTGNNILIAGFVIGGSTPKTVLIRASGPALIPLGVSGALPDPELQLFTANSDGTSTLLQSNTGWAGNPQIASIAASVGAFSWGTSSTSDSAILVTLPPGSYSAGVSGASGDTGIALVEVYDVP
jgi:hypothetical protein